MRVQLSGLVTSNNDAALYRYFGYNDVCCPGDIRTALEQCPEDEELVLEMNSSGGSVYAGFEMYSLLRAAGQKVTAEVQSLAASAMSIVMAGCQKALVSPVANVMIHRAQLTSSGNSETLKQDAQWLDTIDESILNAYAEKAGDKTSRETFRQWMENETFLTAQEAIDCGLADGMTEAPAVDTGAKALAFAASAAGPAPDIAARLMRGLPPVGDLRRRAEEEGLNIATEGTPGVQNIKSAKEREKEMEPREEAKATTAEELMAAFPELTDEVAVSAATAERERIKAITALAMPGFEKQIADAIDDPAKTAGDVAQAIIAAQKKQGGKWLTDTREDVKDSNAGAVNPTESPEDGKTPEAEAEAAAKEAVSLWKKNNKKGEKNNGTDKR